MTPRVADRLPTDFHYRHIGIKPGLRCDVQVVYELFADQAFPHQALLTCSLLPSFSRTSAINHLNCLMSGLRFDVFGSLAQKDRLSVQFFGNMVQLAFAQMISIDFQVDVRHGDNPKPGFLFTIIDLAAFPYRKFSQA